MHRNPARRLRRLAAAGLLAVSSQAAAMDAASVDRAVQANLTLYAADDISYDFHANDARAVDLDGDGVEEILFHLAATCNGANFDCTNELVVLAATQTGKGPPPPPALDADLEAVRRSGYDKADSTQIPGEVERIRVSGNRVYVKFDVKPDSPICKRSVWTGDERKPTTHCPAPGRYEWAYAWAAGKLTRITGP